MRLFYSSSSPFVRKVLVVAHEVGLADQIEIVPAKTTPVAPSAEIRAANPLAQVPTLVTDEGVALYDSRVICEYLDGQAGGRLFGAGAARWRAITEQALADGLLGAALLTRYESALRPQPLRWPDWIGGQMGKVADALDRFERDAASLANRVDIGTITIACGLSYLDFRYGELGWRATRPALARWFEGFAARPSMIATPPAG
ncbi:glutathione S-transferase [Enterovirga sp.]|uniref:glutathione S-transferase n=1 Tax=Enterovirga sp. TaxID=2026350 RepID=UPI0026091CE6|nr:glutathione S-transferase [Enterovirga sp.]MDB5592370.1 glutathione S-transferase, N-terminal domain protein 1 [Enterovirga sp.]